MNILRSTLFSTALLVSVHACPAALLLTDNSSGGDYPGSVAAIATGATYAWGANGAAGNGPGNTDAQTLLQDSGAIKMTDGISAAGGGNYATYSEWDGNVGQTAVFNLNDVYQIDYVTLSAQFNSSSNVAGVGLFQVFTSLDGVNYTLLGRWTDPAPADGSNQILTITAPTPVNAQYVMFYTNRYAPNAGEPELPGQTYYHQVVLGEMAVWGEAVPEPTATGLLLGGSFALGVFRRRRMA